MNITILVPTYNRSHLVNLQLLNIRNVRDLLNELGIHVDVIISDNHSDPAVEIPSAYADFVKLVRPDSHLTSGEANIISAIDKCEGEYIWTLSDDDSPIIQNVVAMFQDIKKNAPDIVVANASAYMKHGVTVKPQIICSDASRILDLPDFVSRAGVWFVLTGFSGLVVRRSDVHLAIDRFRHYYDASKIYSYAMFLLDVFWDRKFMFFNGPIVAGTQNEYGTQWDHMATLDGVFVHFYWTIGFIRQLGILRKSRKVKAGFFGGMIDQNVNVRFHLLSRICHLSLLQLRDDRSEKPSSARTMTQQEFKEVAEFFCSESTMSMMILAPLMKVSDIHAIPIEQINLAIEQIVIMANRYYELFFVKWFGGWNIYRFDNLYRAVPAGHEEDLLELFRDISPISSRWQIVAPTIGEIEHKICACPYPSIFRPDITSVIKSNLESAVKVFNYHNEETRNLARYHYDETLRLARSSHHEMLNLMKTNHDEAIGVQLKIVDVMSIEGPLLRFYHKLRSQLTRT
jgi:hypothetical protein